MRTLRQQGFALGVVVLVVALTVGVGAALAPVPPGVRHWFAWLCGASFAIAAVDVIAMWAALLALYAAPVGVIVENARVMTRLRRAMLDAGFGIERVGIFGSYMELPKIYLDWSRVATAAPRLMIESSVRFVERLRNGDVSAALGGYIVERQYFTDDRNWLICELFDPTAQKQLEFGTLDEFTAWVSETDRHHLRLDGRTTVPISHALIVGQTGSGKSYLLYDLMYQFYVKGATLFCADPKNSGVVALGSSIARGGTAVELDDIMQLLEQFVAAMRRRKNELQERLRNGLDADYSDFGLPPSVLIIDEYAALMYALKAREKKERDHFAELIAEVVLQGRQLGYFLFIAMQKSDASLIDTAFRENLPLVIVMGNAQPQTYVTALGTGVEAPDRDYQMGEGCFTEPHVAPTPRIVQVPRLRFLASGVPVM